MQITKNQHYVPRFYMKPFSNIKNEGTKKEKNLISFYQFENNIIKDDIPTSSICSEDYFYDKNGNIENKLADKERKWAKTFRKINSHSALTQDEIIDVKEFAAFQIARTKAMLIHNQDTATSIVADILHITNEHIDKSIIKDIVSDEVKDWITSEYNLTLVNTILNVIEDLDICVLENKTSTPLFTSDAPVITINPLSINHAGLGNVGTVIFFPCSPQMLIMLYDRKFYGKIVSEIHDIECVDVFNKYQYINAHERILASNSTEFEKHIKDDKLIDIRIKNQNSSQPSNCYDGNGTLTASKSRSTDYFYDIPLLKLPHSLKKIPKNFRETFPREYSFDSRYDILCRIYGQPHFDQNEELRKHWSEQQKYSKVLLDYLDYYWKTPKEDCIITGELMQQIKSTKITFFSAKEYNNINHT